MGAVNLAHSGWNVAIPSAVFLQPRIARRFAHVAIREGMTR
jgi:hypothetical protein